MGINPNTSAHHIFATLREVCASREPLGVAEISRRLGLSLSTAQRALLTLTQSGYLKRHPYMSKYRMGFTAERLVNALLEKFTIRPASVVFLRRLATSARRTASLYVRIGWYSIRLVGIEAGNTPALRTRRMGEAALLDKDAASLAILAFLSLEEAERFTDFMFFNSVDRSLAERLQRIRECGFAYQPATMNGAATGSTEAAPPLESLAFPVTGADGFAVASIAIEGAPAETPLDQHAQRPEWQQIVGELTTLVRTKRGVCVNPFSHLDPQDVHFGPREVEELDDSDAASSDSGRTTPALMTAGMLIGKVAVITEGGSGMGRAAVLRFLQEGAAVVVADRDEKMGRETLSLARAAGLRDARFLRVDVDREEDVRAMIQLATREFGRLDCVLNNIGLAGIADVRGLLLETSLEEFRAVLDTNLLGPFLGLKHGGLALQARGQGGTLIIASSVAAPIEKSRPVYSIARAAIVKLTQGFACELGSSNIRVNSIAPLEAAGSLDEFANAAVFLASDMSRQINGATLVVDGEMLADGDSSWNMVKARGNSRS